MPVVLFYNIIKVLHHKFTELINKFNIDPDFAALFSKALKHYIHKEVFVEPEDKKEREMERAGLKKKVEALEERFAVGEITAEMFSKFSKKFIERLEVIDRELGNNEKLLSNLEKVVKKCDDLSCNIKESWELSTYTQKQKLQHLLFPEGLVYDRKNDNYRTPKENIISTAIYWLSNESGIKKERDVRKISNIPVLVGPPGLEPGTT
jgi:site-specific DNA recombinase